mmetsp:Transcript_97553/g.281506  ORF Transcript_97553/g.281506 Transcript_97553/m.281506 type:complete len:218 (-) Transcript_97553:218-871(-)
MVAFAQLVIVKNTFLQIPEDTPASGGARRRASSSPPAVTPSSTTEVSTREAAVQVLGAAVSRFGESPSRQRWSSFDSEEGDGASNLSPLPSIALTSFLPSLGSAGHATRTCRPCAFARSAAGCKRGAACTFCHVISEHSESVRARPCKGKRDRLKKAMAAIQERVAENPDLLSSGSLSLPAVVDRNPQARARTLAQLAQVAAEAYRGAAQGRSWINA